MIHSMSPPTLIRLGLLLLLCAASTGLGQGKAVPQAGPDSDGDGLSDVDELRFGSDPFLPDTDGDGANDLAELLAGTDPRSASSIPIFVVTDRDRQLLTGDMLRLRPFALRPFSLTTNITFVTNDPPADGGEAQVTTNREVTTNFTTYQWYRDQAALPGQTNLELVVFGMGRPDSGGYVLEARLESSVQRMPRGTRIDVLGARPTRRIPQPVGDVLSWGREFGPVRAPIADALSISAGFVHAYAATQSGRLVGWGTNSVGQLDRTPAATNVVATSAGAVHTLALLDDGGVRGWGDDRFGQSTVPADLTNALQVAAGHFHSLAVRTDGSVTCWGDNSFRQCEVPDIFGTVVAVAGGGGHSVALLADGRVFCWGNNARGQCDVPAALPPIALIAAGANHTVAVSRTGRVFAWGNNAESQATVPASLPPVIAVAAGPNYTLAVTASGAALGWGLPINAAGPPASATNCVAVAAGFGAAHAVRQKPDADQDGLDESLERANGTDPFLADTDGDGLEDGIELRLGLNPTLVDSDGDGVPDLQEVTQSSDSDGDGLPDVEEIRLGLNPLNPDTDGDGFPDGMEQETGTNPLDPNSYPLFSLTARDRQLLVGDMLVLRATEVPPRIVIPAPAPPPDTNAVPPDTGGPVIVITNAPVEPVRPRFQWFRDGRAVAGQTNRNLVMFDIAATDSGSYHLVGSLATEVSTNLQVSRVVRVDVLSLGRPARPLPRSGTVVAWGDETFRQARPPAGLGIVSDLAAGLAHSLALRENGTVVAWGTGAGGQADVPPSLTNAVAIAAGSAHSVALTADGRVVCWGDNTQGQCSVPTNLPPIVAIAAGSLHTVALSADRRVFAWGDTSWGQTAVSGLTATRIFAGQLTSGITGSDGRLDTRGRTPRLRVGPVAGFAPGLDAVTALFRNGAVQGFGAGTVPGDAGPSLQIVGGPAFWASLRADGTVAVWGAGSGVTNVPASLRNVGRLASGDRHMLALVLEEDSDDDGLSDRLELLRGTDPRRVDSDSDGLEDGIEARLGLDPLLADSDGDGLGDLVELRNGFDPVAPSERPDGTLELIPALRLEGFTIGGPGYRLEADIGTTDWVPVIDPLDPPRGRWSRIIEPVVGARGYRIATPQPVPAGPAEVIGNVVAWGDARFGQTSVPTSLGAVQSISAGTWHTLTLLQDGTVRGWGANAEGQRTPPEDVRDVVAVSAGGNHSLALLTDGRVRGWGRNTSGQSTAPRFDAPVTGIAAGGDFNIALLSDGSVAVWGANYGGQTNLPSGLSGITAVAAGWSHGVALRGDGTVACWGENDSGQCLVPVGLGGVVAIAAGDAHTVALRGDGTVVAWGGNDVGQCDVPAGLDDVVAIRAGYNHTLALRRDGRLVSWGGDSSGSLRLPEGVRDPLSFSAGGFHSAVVLRPVDTDGDGLDDRFEARLGSSPALADTDGDGLPDGVEFANGFDLLQPTESPDGTLAVVPMIRLRPFTLREGRYRIASSADLSVWDFEDGVIAGVNGFSERLLEARGATRFYRVVRLQ